MIKTPQDMVCGTIHTTKNNGELVVLKYCNATNVYYRFIKTGYTSVSPARHIRSGEVRDRLFPSVYGVGYLGAGNYRARNKQSFNPYFTTWRSMIQRCYSDNLHKKHPTYKDCIVCDDWLNFQNFAKWHEENHPNDGKEYHLDKDIKIKGNKVYSPDTCLFVSPFENIAEASMKDHVFTNPKGNSVKITNLKRFCEENNLNRQCMHNVQSGLAITHKGWSKG